MGECVAIAKVVGRVVTYMRVKKSRREVAQAIADDIYTDKSRLSFILFQETNDGWVYASTGALLKNYQLSVRPGEPKQEYIQRVQAHLPVRITANDGLQGADVVEIEWTK